MNKPMKGFFSGFLVIAVMSCTSLISSYDFDAELRTDRDVYAQDDQISLRFENSGGVTIVIRNQLFLERRTEDGWEAELLFIDQGKGVTSVWTTTELRPGRVLTDTVSVTDLRGGIAQELRIVALAGRKTKDQKHKVRSNSFRIR